MNEERLKEMAREFDEKTGGGVTGRELYADDVISEYDVVFTDDEMHQFAAQFAQHVLSNQWISVEHEHPPYETPVLVYCGHPSHVGIRTRTAEWADYSDVDMQSGFRFHGFAPTFKPTHWQPLPEPPKK